MWGQIHRVGSYVLTIGAICLWPSQATGVEIAPQRHPVGQKAANAFIPFQASHSLSEPNQQITRLLISVHSSGFDAIQYYDNARAAAAAARVLSQTVILAPQFFEQSAVPGTVPDGLLFWRVSPFRGSSMGGVGAETKKVSISAFEVLDSWLASLTAPELFPNLQDIVLVGHSGGGQFVQRYAMVGKFEPREDLRYRFVVSAPSSYAYPSDERLNPRTNRFVVPDKATLEQCPKYNDWGYGLGTPYAYFSNVDAKMIAKRYATRNVFYLCGSNDANPNDNTIGKNCGATMQGRHRLERMRVFAALLQHQYGRSVNKTHRFAVVQGVGHYGRGTMTSRAGITALFSEIP